MLTQELLKSTPYAHGLSAAPGAKLAEYLHTPLLLVLMAGESAELAASCGLRNQAASCPLT